MGTVGSKERKKHAFQLGLLLDIEGFDFHLAA